jgi:hypothetical protein
VAIADRFEELYEALLLSRAPSKPAPLVATTPFNPAAPRTTQEIRAGKKVGK